MYDRGKASNPELLLQRSDAINWIAHPDEGGKRASHAIASESGVWIIDPIDGPGVDEWIEELGEVVGVTVLTCWHARDAEIFADRYDISVHIPQGMGRIADIVDAPIERYDSDQGFDDFETHWCNPFPMWEEIFLYHEGSGTLIAPDSLGTSGAHITGDERIGLELFRRLQPPTAVADFEPDRILVGHGEPITEDASEALREALDGSRRTFPQAFLSNGPHTLKMLVGALR
jgi:hypothetical protein